MRRGQDSNLQGLAARRFSKPVPYHSVHLSLVHPGGIELPSQLPQSRTLSVELWVLDPHFMPGILLLNQLAALSILDAGTSS